METPIKLTEKQIEFWRRAMFMTFGAYAFVMPSSDVEAYANMMQKRINSLSSETKTK